MPSFEEELFRVPPTEADEEARRALEIRELRKDDFLRSALEEASGRLYFWDFLRRCHISESCWVRDSFDATAFQLGERNIGLGLLADILRISPQAYLLMAEEGPRP